ACAVLHPPTDLAEDDLKRALASGWNLTTTSIEFAPVGFGSHHWHVMDQSGARWFATVDGVEEPDRLEAALFAAHELRDAGLAFVVAPETTIDGRVLVPIDARYRLALYPFVAGESFHGMGYGQREHRLAVLDMVVALHRTRAPAALADDFAVPHRDVL